MSNPEETIATLVQTVQALERRLEEVSLSRQQVQAPVQHYVTPSIPKPEPFSGRTDVHAWIWSLEQYFITTNIVDDASKSQYAVNLLRGNVSSWMRNFAGNGPLPPWPVLSSELKQMFAPISQTQKACDKLAKLKQTKSVAAYANEFRRLILLLSDLPEVHRIDRFTRGLKLPVAREVSLREPRTLDEAIRIADRYDTISWQMRSQRYDVPVPAQPPSQPAPANDAMDLSATRFTRLTTEERKRILENNGCLYCRKLNAGHFARNCPEKKNQSPSN